jgi:hypothetical protein
MYCPSCGSSVEGAFCSKCGAPLQTISTPPPPPPVESRVRSRLQTLGVLWCVFSGYRLISAVFTVLFLRGILSPGLLFGLGPTHDLIYSFNGRVHQPAMPLFLPFLGGVILVISAISVTFSLIVGIALLTRRPWGRVLALIAGFLSLLSIPMGTALGVYTLWTLLPATSAMEYAALADHS